MATEREEQYRTSDLALATVISLSHVIQEVDRQNPCRAEFIFQQSKDLNQIIEAYWKGELQVDPRSFSVRYEPLKRNYIANSNYDHSRTSERVTERSKIVR